MLSLQKVFLLQITGINKRSGAVHKGLKQLLCQRGNRSRQVWLSFWKAKAGTETLASKTKLWYGYIMLQWGVRGCGVWVGVGWGLGGWGAGGRAGEKRRGGATKSKTSHISSRFFVYNQKCWHLSDASLTFKTQNKAHTQIKLLWCPLKLFF